MQLKQTWRWFGPEDPIQLSEIKQTGATGIVTALHQIPHGETWTIEAIQNRKNIIDAAGLTWDVVESVTVHESIKTQSGDYKKYIEQYKQTLRNLSACGIKTVTYNFMPVTDWTRTNLDYVMPDGSRALYFNWFDLAVFDIYILKRKAAADCYPENILKEAERRFRLYSNQQLNDLTAIVLFGIPGEKKLTVDELKSQLDNYKHINHATLRQHLQYFLEQIIPVCEAEGVKMAIHPDDPPFDILGLPRVVSNKNDVDFILNAVDCNNNGFCFCTGSFGASRENNLLKLIYAIDDRIHFIHLRNTKRDEYGNFFEADHLNGDTDMYAIVKAILFIQQKLNTSIPFRPDHGHVTLDDIHKNTNPGYSCIGRMRGLAELRGLMLGICRNNGWK
ncbi:MAG: mannonate dehydratase [Bacteroidetes bacterium]|nr:mannonate dehydratase [Bacteroidota bacterium]